MNVKERWDAAVELFEEIKVAKEFWTTGEKCSVIDWHDVLPIDSTSFRATHSSGEWGYSCSCVWEKDALLKHNATTTRPSTSRERELEESNKSLASGAAVSSIQAVGLRISTGRLKAENRDLKEKVEDLKEEVANLKEEATRRNASPCNHAMEAEVMRANERVAELETETAGYRLSLITANRKKDLFFRHIEHAFSHARCHGEYVEKYLKAALGLKEED